MMNHRSHLTTLLTIVLSLILVTALTSCADKFEKPEPEQEKATETEDFTIYGDESLGIDAGVDEALRNYRSILIAGIDNGNRADIQIILCINKETNEARMFTVTRDAYMQIAHGETVVIGDTELEFCKCNRAYELGDKYDLIKELNRHLDLNIKEFIGVNWPCTAQLVDALGGVTVDVEEGMLEWINNDTLPADQYGAENYQIESAGNQTLNGWQAVEYLRVRKYSGGNARVREDRSRAFVEALLERAKAMPIDEIAEIYDDIAGELDTNMSRTTLTDTLLTLEDTDIHDIGRWPYEYKNRWEPNKKFNYKVPQSLYSNVVQLHAKLFDQNDYLPSTTVQELSDKIVELEENYLVNN